jgi:Transposase zinc-binding domain
MVARAEIFRSHGPQSRAKCRDQRPPSPLRAMQALEQCRTEARGGQGYYGANCHDYPYRYHSGKNRHGPNCQNGAANEWLQRQTDLRLPGPPFLVTFTLPASRRELTRSQPKLFDNILCRSSAQALQDLAVDPRFVGGKLGMVGVLHPGTRAMP